MPDDKKAERMREIKELILAFCGEHLNGELAAYALNLRDAAARKESLAITRGKKEIWAASIIYVIARLNFLFDHASDICITADTICDYFGTVKSTTGNKASLIMKTCYIGPGAAGYCSPIISAVTAFFEIHGILHFPSDAIPRYHIADPEEAAALERRLAEKRRKEEEAKEAEKAERKARRDEINRKIAEEKRKEREENNKKQLNLFDGF